MTVTVPTVAILLPVLAAVAVGWFLLAEWVMEKLDAPVKRWLWRRMERRLGYEPGELRDWSPAFKESAERLGIELPERPR